MKMLKLVTLSVLLVLSMGGFTAAQELRVLAYINVSSGCQQPTVDLLAEFAREHRGEVLLEFVDFGDGGAGQQRWRASGHSCMTIELNGSSHVSYPSGGGSKETNFQMPAGFQWSHDDLQAALQAGIDGTLRILPKPTKSTPVRSVAVKPMVRSGRTYQQVIIGSKPVMSLGTTLGSQSATERARVAAEVIKAWLTRSGKAAEVGTRKLSSGWGVIAGGRLVVTVTSTDAKLQNSTTQSLAEAWAKNLRSAVTTK